MKHGWHTLANIHSLLQNALQMLIAKYISVCHGYGVKISLAVEEQLVTSSQEPQPTMHAQGRHWLASAEIDDHKVRPAVYGMLLWRK